MTESEVRDLVKAAIVRAGSLRKLALEWGVSPAYLSDFVNNRRGPGAGILGPLKLRKVVTVEYLPEEPTPAKRRPKR